jgi:hypothetical protein
MPNIETKAPSRWARFLNANAIIALAVAVALLTFSHWASHDYAPYRSLAREIGFALLVAVTIWGAFELFEQAKTDDEWNERIEKIARNVFFGVFKRNFPEEFIKEANILVLDHTFIRSGLNVTYTISDGSYTAIGRAPRLLKAQSDSLFRCRAGHQATAGTPRQTRLGRSPTPRG